MSERCPICGQVTEMIWVRAHYQCAVCRQVIVACCNGETAFAYPLEAAALGSEPLPATIFVHHTVEQTGEGN